MKEIILSELVSTDEIKGQQGKFINEVGVPSITTTKTDTQIILEFNYLKGSQGVRGVQGHKGEKGVQGSIGVQGRPGSQGVKGNQGDKGATGPIGPTGPQGNNGVQGLKGDQGARGVQGLKGDQGVKGNQGEKGATGPQGEKADMSNYYDKSEINTKVSGLQTSVTNLDKRESTHYNGIRERIAGVQNHILELIEIHNTDVVGLNTKIEKIKGNTGPQGVKGPQGSRGVQGSRGATPSTSNFVTTNTVQTISGNKTFTGTQCKFTNYVVFSNGAGTSSDIRFKTNITPITNVLEDILKIDIFNYTWDKEGEKCFDTLGISAQQMEELGEPFSKLVHIAEDEDKTRSVEYSKLSVITIKAIQEMYEENKILKNKIHELELKIDNLISK